jgi:hypothetical protein
MKKVRKTQDEFVQNMNDLYGNEYEVIGQYVNNKTKILIKHKLCECEFSKRPSELLRGKCYCIKCYPNHDVKDVVIGVNDMWTTEPEVAKLLKNHEDGFKFKRTTNQKLLFLCQKCNSEVKIEPYSVKKLGNVPCKICSDGISYPNKFLYNMLQQLNITFIPEYSPEWIKPKSYDCYFEINNKKYIIEMDGGLGHGVRVHSHSKKSLNETIEVDLYKEEQAKLHDISVFRIDCNYKHVRRFEHITTNIKYSILSEIFDLSKVDFHQCDLNANSSLLIKSIEMWSLSNHSIDEIAKQLNVCKATVLTYLKQGEKYGLCLLRNNVINISNKKRGKNFTKTHGCKVRCIETNETFISFAEASRKYKGIDLTRYFKRGDKYAGKLPDGTKLTWEKQTNTNK